MRVGIYARYSSELQSKHSIEDQIALCRDRAKSENWTVVGTFTDYAISGATAQRPGLNALMEAARENKIDIVISEALDRLSRDQADIATLYKRLVAWQVPLFTLSEGEISELHIGLKGTMNALFLKDLAAKSLRGQIGRAREGRAAGGIPYGYKVVREIDANGEVRRGGREIVEEQAETIRRVYREFVAGRSSIAIAKGLNADGIPSPRGGQWNPSTIQGHRGRGVGMLSNPLYVGRQVFNRHAFIKDPDTGTRRARMKDKSDWIEADVPELAIVDEDLWNAVQEHLASMPARPTVLKRRPRRLFSGLIQCGECGGNLTIINKDRYGCMAARQKGTCSNKRTMSAPDIEKRILNGLKDQLVEPKLVEAYLTEYHDEIQRLQGDRRRKRRAATKERTDIERQIGRLVDAIAEGNAASVTAVTEKLQILEARLAELDVPEEEPPEIDWHPNAVKAHKRQLVDLQAALNKDEIARQEATNALRGLVDKIVAYPAEKRGQFDLELHGHLAAALATQKHCSVGGGRGTLRPFIKIP